MHLHIVQNHTSLLISEATNIAGKKIIEYWLDWALYQKYTKLCIYTDTKMLTDKEVQDYQNLYNITIAYLPLSQKNIVLQEKNIFYGIGIFMDSGTYRVFEDLHALLLFERELIKTPLPYCSHSGYTDASEIKIGKNVYMHKSVKLSGVVIIADNCIIEKGVKIHNSIIGAGSIIKQQSIIENSHIAQDIHMVSSLYLKEKALFKSSIYCLATKQEVPHDGLCTNNE